MQSKFTPDVVECIRLAARKLSSYRRHEHQAEMALKYCDGSSRKAKVKVGNSSRGLVAVKAHDHDMGYDAVLTSLRHP